MNEKSSIIKQLGYNSVLLSMAEVARQYPDYQDLTTLGADECYFIAGHPAALFNRTQDFGRDYAKRIAEILHKAWNYRKVLLLVAYSDFEVRVYNCHTKPSYVRNNEEYTKEINAAQIGQSSIKDTGFSVFASYFSREAIDTGALWSANNDAIKIDVSKRVDAYLVDSLDRTKEKLLKDGLKEDYIHALLIRSLFVLFLEDKGATAEAGIYSSIKTDCTSYFDILKNKEATYKLFDVLNQQFNGDITHLHNGEREAVEQRHLDVVRRCFYDGDLSDNPKMFGDWRLFRFDIIRVELLSEIYEHFLGASRAARGQYYTPTNLVELILSEKIPIDSKKWNMKVLDPACGSGIFLVESYKRLIRAWKTVHGTNSIDFHTLVSILCNSIYGIDIDSTALSVAAFSLYLTLVNELDPRTLWATPNCKLPCLIHHGKDNEKVEGNLWCGDAIKTDFSQLLPAVDLIVGNPPYGTKHQQKSISAYCKARRFANEMSLPFIHKAASMCPNGEIALVVNMKIMTNTNGTYAQFRNWLLNEAYIEKIYNFSVFRHAPSNFGGSLFSSASAPVAVLFYKASRPNIVSSSITYWAPRTYVKSNMLYDIVLDSCDIKYLPRVICEQNYVNVWKIGAWGNMLAFRLVKRLGMEPTLHDTFKQNEWIFGRGCNADSTRQDFVPNSILSLKFGRYHIAKEAAKQNNSGKSYRNNKQDIFNPPFVVMKECPDKDGVIAGIFDGEAVTTTSTFVFNGMSEDDKIILATYLNSKLASTFLFLTSSTWGIERDRLLLEDEALRLPSPFERITTIQKQEIINLFRQICSKQKGVMRQGYGEEVRQIDRLYYDIFSLSELEIEVLNDVNLYSQRLFTLQENSEAMRCTSESILANYANRICRALNDYYRYSDTKVSPEVLVPNTFIPLNMVIIRFGHSEKSLRKLDSTEDRELLRKLYDALNTKPSDGITIQRVLREYRENSIVLIKPNQRRYWTEMQALEDGASIFSEILAMKESKNG